MTARPGLYILVLFTLIHSCSTNVRTGRMEAKMDAQAQCKAAAKGAE